MRMVLLRKRTLLCAVLTVALLGSGWMLFRENSLGTFQTAAPAATVVIDAGHGGVDGGAVAQDGTVESGINLAVAKTVRELFLFCGIEPVMTRETDVSLHSDDAATIAQKKVSDLKNRVALINANPQAVLISIHQNSLPTAPSVRGAQVFYNTVDGAAELAHTMQQTLNAAINTHAAKTEKQIPSTIYLMQHAQIPAVLVECGFLSNAEETALLKTEEHRLRLALCIVCGCELTEKENDP